MSLFLNLEIRSLSEGDVIVLGAVEGPVVTTIQALLTAGPCDDLRSNPDYPPQ
jgi:translation initiation factor IF-2